ncbi:MAG TPA: hypothetical protein VN108_04880 [Marmoricola sp.]|nr:hypothetical protein [Marmoricola sp.]
MSGENYDFLIAEIAADPWRGRGGDLLSLLAHPDVGVRSAAAVRVGQLLSESEEVGLPDRRAVFDLVRRRDAEQPGVADAFLTTIIYGYRTRDEHGDLKQWVLTVLEGARKVSRHGTRSRAQPKQARRGQDPTHPISGRGGNPAH